MKFAIDRIEDKIVILENIDTKEIKEVDKDLFNFDIYDGRIVKLVNGIYVPDTLEEKLRKEKIAKRFNRLKKKRNNIQN